MKKVVKTQSIEKLAFPDLGNCIFLSIIDCLEILKNLAIAGDDTVEDSEDDFEKLSSDRSDIQSKNNDKLKRNIIYDVALDKEVLHLSIKAMDKLINYFHPNSAAQDHGNNPILQFKKSQSPLSIQIIPNVNRIRIEKARAVSAIRDRKCSLQELIEECKLQKNSEELYSAEEIEPISYYRENIFNIEDYYLYRAIMKFYYEDYESAIKDLKTCNRLKSISKANQNKNKHNENKSSHMSSQTDLSDIGL